MNEGKRTVRVIEMPSAEVVLGGITSESHRKDASLCACGNDVSRVGLPELVYFFGECECAEFDYLHLTERVWHRSCFLREFADGEA